jgi:hypothetical protein
MAMKHVAMSCYILADFTLETIIEAEKIWLNCCPGFDFSI